MIKIMLDARALACAFFFINTCLKCLFFPQIGFNLPLTTYP